VSVIRRCGLATWSVWLKAPDSQANLGSVGTSLPKLKRMLRMKFGEEDRRGWRCRFPLHGRDADAGRLDLSRTTLRRSERQNAFGVADVDTVTRGDGGTDRSSTARVERTDQFGW
jgi:hypothetical protein